MPSEEYSALVTKSTGKLSTLVTLLTLRKSVVSKMVSATHLSDFKDFIKSNNKIPPYAKNFKKEYLFIRGINKEFKYFKNKLDKLNDGLFESNISNRIKYNMKRFLRGQEKGKIKDISNLMLPRYDVDNLIFINNKFRMYKIRWDFFNVSDDSDDSDDEDDGSDDVDVDVDVGIDDEDDGKNVYPGFKEIYDIFKLFFSKLNIEYEDSDSDEYDSDSEELNISYTDSDIEDFCNNLNILINF